MSFVRFKRTSIKLTYGKYNRDNNKTSHSYNNASWGNFSNKTKH